MANKTKSSSLPEGATRDVDAILAAYASGSIPTAAELKRVLASFSAWLPYLGRKLQQGPAPLRKAAISVLKDSGTRPGVEAIQAAARDSRMPAWLRSTAVEALAEGDRDPAVVSALAAQAAIAPGSDSLAAASPADRKARIQLLVEGAEGAGLPAIVSSRPELLAPIADAIVECETEGVGRLIAELLDVVSGKEQEKILRRAWHALRQKGIALPELKRGAVARPAAPTEATAYASYVDAEGSRMVLVMRARVHEAGGDLLQFILNDERGMLDYTRAWLPKRDLVPLVEEFQRREKGLRLAPIDPVWALKLARDAYQCSRRVKYEVPEEYVRERDGFEEGMRIDRPDLVTEARAAVPASEIGSVDLGATERLATLQEIETWGPPLPAAMGAADRRIEIEDGPIVTSAALREGRLQEEADRGLRETYDAERRALMARRLDEMASYYLRLGMREESVLCLAASDHLAAPDADPAKSPVLRRLWERRVSDLAGLKKEQKKSDLVQPPSAIVGGS